MHITTTNPNNRLSEIVMIHNGEEIHWDCTVLNKAANKTGVSEIFEYLNMYWTTLPPGVQRAIFEKYKEMRNALNEVFDNTYLIKTLMGLSKQLYDLHPEEEFSYWVKNKSGIKVPVTLTDTHNVDYDRDTTYLRSDYMDLIVLALACRLLVPIWGVFIGRFGNDYGTIYKEWMAIKIMYKSWPHVTKAKDKLMHYLEMSVDKDTSSPQYAAILDGLGSANTVDWLYAMAIIRRASVGVVSSTEESDMMVSNIYNYILNNCYRQMDKKFSAPVTPKYDDKKYGNREDRSSIVEQFKLKTPLSGGDLMVMNVYTEMPHDVAMKLDPSLNSNLLVQCLDTLMGNIHNLEIMSHHRILTQWVMSPVIPPRGIQSLNLMALGRCMAITQSLLWHWGFPDIAAMMSATPVEYGDHDIGTTSVRQKIEKELIDALIEMTPYYYPSVGKLANDPHEKQQRANNVSLSAIDQLVHEVMDTVWEVNIPEDLLKVTSVNRATKRFIIPTDIKSQLARMLLRINNRPVVTSVSVA